MLFSGFMLTAFGQEACSKSFSASIDARKMDYFFGVDYHIKFEKFYLALGVETGIIKTAFQQRLFPGIHLQATYPLIKKERFTFAPAIDLNANALQIQRKSRHLNLFQEFRLGYDLRWGNKFKFIHSAGLGIIGEHFYGAYSQKYKTAFDIGYSIKLGCLYEF